MTPINQRYDFWNLARAPGPPNLQYAKKKVRIKHVKRFLCIEGNVTDALRQRTLRKQRVEKTNTDTCMSNCCTQEVHWLGADGSFSAHAERPRVLDQSPQFPAYRLPNNET